MKIIQHGDVQFISTLDLTQGYYWQVLSSDKVKQKSAFMTSFGDFKMNVKPVGKVNAGATFQCMVDNLLAGKEEPCQGLCR